MIDELRCKIQYKTTPYDLFKDRDANVEALEQLGKDGLPILDRPISGEQSPCGLALMTPQAVASLGCGLHRASLAGCALKLSHNENDCCVYGPRPSSEDRSTRARTM